MNSLSPRIKIKLNYYPYSITNYLLQNSTRHSLKHYSQHSLKELKSKWLSIEMLFLLSWNNLHLLLSPLTHLISLSRPRTKLLSMELLFHKIRPSKNPTASKSLKDLMFIILLLKHITQPIVLQMLKGIAIFIFLI